MIYILEDNDDRTIQFKMAAASIAPGIRVRVWQSATRMIEELKDSEEIPSLISLDHDLIPSPNAIDDPGTGLDVAKMFAKLIPFCPVIVHTSNAPAGASMVYELSRAGWHVERIYPIGDDWISHDWSQTVQKYLDQQK
jgi:hypothetical protein